MKVYLQDITIQRGEWITLPIEKLNIDPNHEYMIYDYDLPFNIGEYTPIEEVNRISKILGDIDPVHVKLVDRCADNTDHMLEVIETETYSVIEMDEQLNNYEDYSRKLYEEGFRLDIGDIPEHLMDYMDWEGIWREYNINGGWHNIIFDNVTYLVTVT